MSKKKVLSMVFDTQESLDKFARYMDSYGEQMYSEWMDGADEGGTNTVRFNYWPNGFGGSHHANNVILCPLKNRENDDDQ